MLGRTDERDRIERLLADARTGAGGALVIRGEAGIGKTALLDHATATAAGMRVLRGVGIESEIEVPFAGLHLLLHPYLAHLDALPPPQAQALRTAFGLTDDGAGAGERFLIGAATMSLLSELGRESPLVCLIDDAQWFDPASADALRFAARRLRLEPVAIVFAVRDGADRFSVAGIDTMTLTGLDRTSAMTLLNQRAHGIAGPTRARILAEARGNPLAIVEFTAALTDRDRLRGRHWSSPVEPLPVSGQVQEAFRARIRDLPEAARSLLLLAAADDTADLAVVLRAGERLGLSAADLEPAERADLIELTADSIVFRHPLIRAAAYQGASRARAEAAHRALADTHTTDRRTWHLAAATALPDETIAVELERAAARAAQRGGSGAVATALERAAQLSTSDRKGLRLVRSARAAYEAGWLDRATESSVAAADLTSDESVLAEAAWVRAQVAYERESPAAAAALMLDGAIPIVRSHPEQAVSILTDAIGCAKDAGAHDLVRRSAEQMALVPLGPDSPLRPVVAGMVGLGDHFAGATERAVSGMGVLVTAARDGRVTGLVERVLASYLALVIADDEAASDLLEAMVSDTRRQGALGWLPYAQEPLAIALLLRGRFRDAEMTVAEALTVSADLGQDTQVIILNAIPAWLAAVAGDAERCEACAGTVLRHNELHATNAALATWALGLLDLGRGRHDAAVDRLGAVCAGPARRDFPVRAIPDQVEAAVRSGQATQAARNLPELEQWAAHTGQPHAAALVHRCHALLSTEHVAEAHYEAALRLHRDADRPYDYARTALLYGEWLRRKRRRNDAQSHLAAALAGFEQLGADAWAARAHAELSAFGDRPVARPHDRDPVARLTPQERQVVRLAAAGLSNRDIASQLFLSPRTVGHHLYRAYPKLGVSKRTELGRIAL